MDDSEFLYKLSVRLDCTTFGVFLLVIAREKKKEKNRFIEGRTTVELARAYDNNYIKCGYVPQFAVDQCREMLGQYENFARVSNERMKRRSNASHPRTSPHLTLVVGANRA